MSLLEIARRLLDRAGHPGPFNLVPLSGGRNNRVWRVRIEASDLLLKQYYWVQNDTRDRMGHEWAFLSYLHRIGSRAAAIPIAADQENRCALLEFIHGAPPALAEITEPDVHSVADFFFEMNAARFSEAASSLPPASEACFSVSEHIETTGRRIRRLDDLHGESGLHREARAFVAETLLPLWECARARVIAAPGGAGGLLAPGQRCLSPSDLGFHNSLRTPAGGLRFVDFEYAGWDDPAKTIIDFANQPDMLLDSRLSGIFSTRVLALFPGEDLPARLSLLTPVYQIKWACICLNEFLASGAHRRAFTGLESGTGLTRLAGHLARARLMASRAADGLGARN